jgi:peroxiredoxin
MSQEQSKNSTFLILAIAAVLVVVAALFWAITRRHNKQTAYNAPSREQPVYTETQHNNPAQDETSGSSSGIITERTTPFTGQERQQMQLPHAEVASGATLQQIVDARRTWDPIAQQWYGRQAPDFALNDLQGKTHKLSDYKGRNVMVVFWATWCHFCTMEIPDLNLLDKRASDQLKIIAVTNEDPKRVQSFVSAHNMNYTVLLDDGKMADFYRAVPAVGIPATAFIDPQGKVKFAVSGLLPIDDTKAIISAKQ